MIKVPIVAAGGYERVGVRGRPRNVHHGVRVPFQHMRARPALHTIMLRGSNFLRFHQHLHVAKRDVSCVRGARNEGVAGGHIVRVHAMSKLECMHCTHCVRVP